jgi:hypothetical protein
MVSENAQSSGLPIRYEYHARQTQHLTGDRFGPTNFLYVLWEIKAPVEMLTILWSSSVQSSWQHQPTTPMFVNQCLAYLGIR